MPQSLRSAVPREWIMSRPVSLVRMMTGVLLLVLGASMFALASDPFPAAPAGNGPIQAAGQATVPKFSHVILILIENKEYEDVIGNAGAPNFNRLARQSTLLTRYYAVTHPSLPNYMALIGGDTFGILNDCSDCFVKAGSLPDLLEASGRTWKTYQESLPSAGFLGERSGRYVMKHNPFAYFEGIRADAARCRRSIVPLTQLAKDLKQNKLPDFAFIMPDLCHSAHDCGLEVADAWLGRLVKSILDSPSFDRNSLLVLTFDEGTTLQGCCGPTPLFFGGHIATVLISPLAKPGFADPTPYSHYSLLKTIEEAWGLEKLGHTGEAAIDPIALAWRK
jgi:hypothetical protein